jgi:hypothetical protein
MRASVAVSQQITGSFQISGIFRPDRPSVRAHGGQRASARQRHAQGSPAAHALLPMKDGHAPIIVADSTFQIPGKMHGI